MLTTETKFVLNLIMKPHFPEGHLSYSQHLLGQNLSSYTIGALSCEEDEREIRLQHVIIASQSLPARPSVPVFFLKGLMPLKLMQFLAITFQKTNKKPTPPPPPNKTFKFSLSRNVYIFTILQICFFI